MSPTYDEDRYDITDEARQASSDGTPPPGDVLTSVSNGMVALLKEFYGRGPTRAKSYFQDDLVVCVLRGGFSHGLDAVRDEAGRAYGTAWLPHALGHLGHPALSDVR